MDEDTTQEIPIATVEAKTLTEDITEFNQKLEKAIEDLNTWKTNLANLQEMFVDKLRKKTLGMKIQ